jgi:hypothetical protein
MVSSAALAVGGATLGADPNLTSPILHFLLIFSQKRRFVEKLGGKGRI